MIPHALWTKKQNMKQKQCCHKLNRGLEKDDPHEKILKKKKKRVLGMHRKALCRTFIPKLIVTPPSVLSTVQ